MYPNSPILSPAGGIGTDTHPVKNDAPNRINDITIITRANFFGFIFSGTQNIFLYLILGKKLLLETKSKSYNKIKYWALFYN